jgi:hypothetical protein
MNVVLLLARLETQRRELEERLCKVNLAENKNHYLMIRGEISGLDRAIKIVGDMYHADL